MHAKYVRLYKNNNEHQTQSPAQPAAIPLLESPKIRVPVESPKPLQTSPSRPLASPHLTDRDCELEDNVQQKMVYDMYTIAAIRIQAAFRGFWARDSLDVDHFCATLIQKCARRYVHEQKYKHGHYHVFRYAVRIQAMWRVVLARQNLHRSIGAAILIQAYARGFIGRRLGRLEKIYSSRMLQTTYRSENSAMSQKGADSSWQKGLANDIWQARKVRISDGDKKKNPILPRPLISSPPTTDYMNSSSEKQSRSLNFVDFNSQRTGSSATQELFQEKLRGNHYQPNTSRRENLSRVAIIKASAAIKVQARYRTYVCERKLTRQIRHFDPPKAAL